MKASIVIPFHQRENALPRLIERVLPALGQQGFHSINAEIAISYLWDFNNTYGIENLSVYSLIDVETELIIVGDKAVRPDTKNCCLQINVGLKQAKNDVFVLLQQDVEPEPDAISSMINFIAENPSRLVWANVFKEKYPDDPTPYYWVGPKRKNEAWFLIAANREKIVDLGGIDEDFWQFWGVEDLEFLDRVKRHLDVLYVDWARGLHLWHEEHPAETKCGHNMTLYQEKLKDPERIANLNRNWGNIYVGE